MPLSAATKLGSYEILAPIGAGGMGEVYRAKDTLEREVAIKVLPPAVAGPVTEENKTSLQVTFLFNFFDELRRRTSQAK